MTLLDKLRTTTRQRNEESQQPLPPSVWQEMVLKTLERWKGIWAEELFLAADSGANRCALSFGIIGAERTPYKRRELEKFLTSHQLSFEEGRAHYVTTTDGEWQVEGFFVVKW